MSEATKADPVAAADLALVPTPAPAPAPATERLIAPELPGLAFLGLPPLPALTTQERSVEGGPGALPPMPGQPGNVGSPVGAESAASAPDPNVNRPYTINDDGTPNALAPAFADAQKTFQVGSALPSCL